MITCPKCKHSWEPEPTWRGYLSKANGEHHKVHFFTNKGTMTEPKVERIRLYFKKGTLTDIIRAALELTAIEHKHDAFFRWCDTPDNSIESVLKMLGS